jgi:hypothetical protein
MANFAFYLLNNLFYFIFLVPRKTVWMVIINSQASMSNTDWQTFYQGEGGRGIAYNIPNFNATPFSDPILTPKTPSTPFNSQNLVPLGPSSVDLPQRESLGKHHSQKRQRPSLEYTKCENCRTSKVKVNRQPSSFQTPIGYMLS